MVTKSEVLLVFSHVLISHLKIDSSIQQILGTVFLIFTIICMKDTCSLRFQMSVFFFFLIINKIILFFKPFEKHVDHEFIIFHRVQGIITIHNHSILF